MNAPAPSTKHRRRLVLEIGLLVLCCLIGGTLWFVRERSRRTLETATAEQLERITQKETGNAEAFYRLGLRYQEKGEAEKAKTALKKAAEIDADFTDAWVAWARVAEGQGELKEAFAVLDVFLKSHPNDADALIALATFYHNQDAVTRAYETVKKATASDPKNVRAWRRQATEAYSLQVFAEAETAIRTALTLVPNDWRSHYLLGTILVKLRRPDDALTSLRKASELAPTESAPLREIGRLELDRSADEEGAKRAEIVLKQAFEKTPDDAGVRLLLGRTAIRLRNWPEARRHLEAVVQAQPTDPDGFFELAKVYRQVGDKPREQATQKRHDELRAYRLARFNLQSLIFQDKGDTAKNNARRLELARLFARYGDYELAVREYRHLLARTPGDVVVSRELQAAQEAIRSGVPPLAAADPAKLSVEELLRLGDDQMQRRQFGQAKRFYTQALVKNPKRAIAFLGLGQALMAEGNQPDAFRAFQKAAALDPELDVAEYWIAQIYLNLGFGDEAIKHLEPIVKKRPENAAYQNLLGLGYQRVEVYGMAERHFARAVAADPNEVDYLVNLAFVEAKNRKNAEAERHYREAAKRAPDNGTLLAFFGSFLSDLGTERKDDALVREAEEILKRSLSLVPKNFTAAFALGNLYLNRNEAALAIPYLTMANEAQPDLIQPWYRLSLAYSRLGDRAKTDYYRQEFRRRQEYSDRRNATEMLTRERIKDPDLRVKLARIYAEGGDFERAINQYQVALSLKPGNPVAKKEMDALVETLRKQGRNPRMDAFQGIVSGSLALRNREKTASDDSTTGPRTR
ncbi:MAG: tetratricopeptide repeat protein [Capsulimonadales bacterium]|nr:tetratricopeptide repeat protein [Capsulimonadales bacterium]